MDTQAKEQLKKQVYTFIIGQPMGVISTIAHDNSPESASVNFLVDPDWTLYIITSKDSRKAHNLQQNPRIAFVVGSSPTPNTVQIQGTAELIEDSNPQYAEYRQKMVDSKRLERDPPYDVFGNNYVILKIKIDWLRWLFFDSSSGKPVYTVLIP